MAKTISIRLDDNEEKILNMYTKELKKSFQGLKVDTSTALRRALFYAANNDPCSKGKIKTNTFNKLSE